MNRSASMCRSTQVFAVPGSRPCTVLINLHRPEHQYGATNQKISAWHDAMQVKSLFFVVFLIPPVAIRRFCAGQVRAGAVLRVLSGKVIMVLMTERNYDLAAPVK